ncbi:hypothetical protein F5Y04DRAFT_276931 [Hypomontagnella monticulosa]|nr:hypothetical protein F5Y04DRAFT_276931 [Hypomontagnella monticulosa]
MLTLSTLVTVFLSLTATAQQVTPAIAGHECTNHIDPYNTTDPGSVQRRCEEIHMYNTTNPDEKLTEVFNYTRRATEPNKPVELIELSKDTGSVGKLVEMYNRIRLQNASEPTVNITQDAGYVCHPNFAPGVRITPDEIPVMIDCYETLIKGRWLNDPIHCARTSKWFQTWGQNWDNPDDCYGGCKWCFASAVAEGAANFRCFESAGVNAKCHVMYA